MLTIKEPSGVRACFDAHRDERCDATIKASERRVLIETWLDEAWIEFFDEGDQTQVTKAFKRCGIYNAIDRSERIEMRARDRRL